MLGTELDFGARENTPATLVQDKRILQNVQLLFFFPSVKRGSINLLLLVELTLWDILSEMWFNKEACLLFITLLVLSLSEFML